MRIKSLICILLAISFIGIISMPAVYAARRDQSKIGVFDIQRIIQESKAGREARETLEKGINERRATLAKKEQELQQLQQQLAAKQEADPLGKRH